ncbi:MAG: AsmA family protein [Oricola sp.]
MRRATGGQRDDRSSELARLFVIVGGLVVLVLIAALVAPYFINWTEYRSDFEREASRILGQPVTVAGDAKARLLPFPSVTFEDVRVGPADKPLVVAERFSMDAELAPFLSGEVLIFDMRLVKPTITLELNERGLPDWPLPDDSPVSPAQVTLENARIIDATMVLDDRVAGRTWMVDGLNASVSAENLYGPYRIDGEGTLDRTPVSFRINTGALSKEGFSLRTNLELPLAGIEIAVEGRVAEPEPTDTGPYNGSFTIRPLAAMAMDRYVVQGRFSASPRAVSVAEYRGEFGDPKDPYVVTGSAGITGGAEPRYHVEVKGTQVTLAETGAEQPQADQKPAVSFSDRLARVQAMLAALPFPPIPGSIDVDLPAIVAGDTTIRDIRLAAAPDDSGGADARRRWKVSRFTAELPGRTAIEADGTLQMPLGDAGKENQASFAGNLLVASRQPSGLATWLTGAADEPIRRLDNAGFAAKVDITPVRQDVQDLEVILGPARMRGSLTRVSEPDRRSTLDVELSGEAIDFDTLQALATVFVGQDGAARYADHDLDVALDLKQPDILGVKLETLQAAIRSRDTRTEIDRLSLSGLYGASVSATASLDRRADGMHAGIDATVLTDNGAQLVAGLSRQFPDARPLSALAEIAARNGRVFDGTRLDVVGALAFKQKLAGEASLSVSGEAGGTKLSLTSTAKGSLDDAEAAAVSLNASFDNPIAERLFNQLGLSTFPVESAGPVRMQAEMNGSLSDGMKTVVTLIGEDMLADFEGVTTSDILSTGFTGNALVESADIEPWMMALGYGLPGMGLGTTADIQTALSWRKGKAVLRDINATLNGAKTTGELTVDTTGAVPTVRGDMAFETLDAGQIFAIISGDAAASILGATAEDALAMEFGPPILPDHDVEIGLKAMDVTLPVGNENMSDLSATLVYRGGEMALRDIAGGFGGGKVAGLIDLQNTDGTLVLNAQLSGDDVATASLLPPTRDTIAGKTDFALQLTGNGGSNEALLTSLTGSGVLSTGPLTVNGLNAGGFAPMIAKADAIGHEITPDQIREIATQAFLTGTADLPAADYPVTVTNGEMRIANATAKAGALSIDADAGATLVSGVISGRARLGFDPGEEAAAGPQPEITLAFRSAEEDGFTVERDFGPVTGFLTQRALEREQARVEALQARLLEKQRLRREVQLFTYRKRMRLQSFEETRLRALEDERTARAQEAEAAAAAEVARRLDAGEPNRGGGAETGDTAEPSGTSIPQIIDMERLNEFLPGQVIRRDLPPVQ